jgi:hypothetical protein
MWTSGYRSRIDKATEHGAPGYYSVELLDYHVKAELTATMRCGAMRLTYPATDEAHLLLDFAFPTEELCRIIEASATQTGPNEITGHIRQSNNYTGEYTVYFVIRTDKPLASLDAWQRDPYTGKSTNYGTDWRAPVHYQRGLRAFTGHDLRRGAELPDRRRRADPGAHGNLAGQRGPGAPQPRHRAESLRLGFRRRRAARPRDLGRVLGGVEVAGGTAPNSARCSTPASTAPIPPRA